MNLYLKYRPTDLESVIGNEGTVTTIQSFFEKGGRLPHVILLYGPTGCGKTTLARILARKLECADEDFMEINTADFRGINTVRELIKGSRYYSFSGGVRFYLIDEIHKMTGDAQNAFLKLLEDTPAQSYFVLCTTEPEKLLPTIRGRCVQLKVSLLSDREMRRLLKRVCEEEGVEMDRKVLDQITSSSAGHPRNALQILEKIIHIPEDKRVEMAEQISVDVNQTNELCKALLQGMKWEAVGKILNGLKNEEPETVRRHILFYCKSVLIKSRNDRAAMIIEHFWEPLYDIGYPGLVYCCYSVINGK